MNFTTIEQLPQAVNQLLNKLKEIEGLLLLKSNEPHSKADELLTVQDTAKFLTLSVPTVYGLISRGAIPCMKRSKRVYFSKSELINYLQQGKKKTVSDFEAEADTYLGSCKRKGVSHA